MIRAHSLMYTSRFIVSGILEILTTISLMVSAFLIGSLSASLASKDALKEIKSFAFSSK